jgi:deoxyribonuclease IV
MRLGVHVPIAGGVLEAVVRAKRLQCTAMQIFSRSPRGGTPPPISPDTARQFDAARRDAGIEPLAVHGPYIINLASPEPAMWKRGVALYRDEYTRTASLGAAYLVTHVGSHRGDGEAAGLARVAEAVNQTLDPAGDGPGPMILLENTAGSGQGLGYSFEQLAAIRNGVSRRARVGICLDTAHLFAAGYAIHTPDGLLRTIESFDRAVGLEHLKMIHLNDSKVPFDSRVDRHWHIGQGHIGLDAFRRIVTHPVLREVPFILETPKTTELEDQRNLATVRGLLSEAPVARRRSTAKAAT